MSTKKLSHNLLSNKIKKETIKNIETLEGKEMVKNQIKTNKIRAHKTKRGFKRTRNEKFE